MKVTLTFTYDVLDSDGVGTSNDALIVAFNDMMRRIEAADSTDSLGDVFTIDIT